MKGEQVLSTVTVFTLTIFSSDAYIGATHLPIKAKTMAMDYPMFVSFGIVVPMWLRTYSRNVLL